MKLKKSFNKTPRIMRINFIQPEKRELWTKSRRDNVFNAAADDGGGWECVFHADNDDAKKAIKTNISFSCQTNWRQRRNGENFKLWNFRDFIIGLELLMTWDVLAWCLLRRDNDRRLIAIITSNNLNNHNFKHSHIKLAMLLVLVLCHD